MPITLSSDALEATITPERGADIVQIVDRATATPLLAESPTGSASASATPADGLDGGVAARLSRRVAAAGAERRTRARARRSETGVPRRGLARGVGRAGSGCRVLRTRDAPDDRAPAHPAVGEVSGDTLTVTDALSNLSADPVQTRIVQHPAFGSAFLDGESYVLTSAATIVTDAEAPGTTGQRRRHRAPGRGAPPRTGRRKHPAAGPRVRAPRCSPRSPTSPRPRRRSAVRRAGSLSGSPGTSPCSRTRGCGSRRTRRPRLAVVPPSVCRRDRAGERDPRRGRAAPASQGWPGHRDRRRRVAHPDDLAQTRRRCPT